MAIGSGARAKVVKWMWTNVSQLDNMCDLSSQALCMVKNGWHIIRRQWVVDLAPETITSKLASYRSRNGQ